MPASVGVPLIVIVFEAQLAETPAGKFTGVPIPVAVMVSCVISGIAVFIHKVGEEEGASALLFASTITG
ncbi:hypothetical protein D3C85_1129280 [compost metagenome]